MKMNEKLEQKLLSKKIKPTTMRLLVLQELMLRPSAIGLTELEIPLRELTVLLCTVH